MLDIPLLNVTRLCRSKNVEAIWMRVGLSPLRTQLDTESLLRAARTRRGVRMMVVSCYSAKLRVATGRLTSHINRDNPKKKCLKLGCTSEI